MLGAQSDFRCRLHSHSLSAGGRPEQELGGAQLQAPGPGGYHKPGHTGQGPVPAGLRETGSLVLSRQGLEEVFMFSLN